MGRVAGLSQPEARRIAGAILILHRHRPSTGGGRSGPLDRIAQRKVQHDATPAVRCVGVVKRYGNVVAVNGFDLEVHRGECFGMLGPNGAGKTSTVEIIEGLREPDAGEVEVLGDRWHGDNLPLRARLGIQLQETKFPEKLRVSEVLTLFRSFYPRGLDVDALLSLVSLEDKASAQVRTLSGGQKQRLSLGCALAGEPELLFLDEPTTGLDPQSRRQTWEIVDALKARGGTVLLTTHYMEEATRLCDRLAVVDQGRVIALGTPDELIASLGTGPGATLEDVFVALTGRRLRDA